jgi:hypothetical protein
MFINAEVRTYGAHGMLSRQQLATSASPHHHAQPVQKRRKVKSFGL